MMSSYISADIMSSTFLKKFFQACSKMPTKPEKSTLFRQKNFFEIYFFWWQKGAKMTEEQKKKRLSEYWLIEKRVRELEKELTEEFYNMFNSFSSDNPKPKNHEPKSPIENKVCRLVTKEKELRKLQKEKRIIEKALKNLKPNEEQIIREHDINGYSIHYISIRNKMSYKYLIALHKKAINKINF